MKDEQLLISQVRFRFPALNICSEPLRGQIIYRSSMTALAERLLFQHNSARTIRNQKKNTQPNPKAQLRLGMSSSLS